MKLNQMKILPAALATVAMTLAQPVSAQQHERRAENSRPQGEAVQRDRAQARAETPRRTEAQRVETPRQAEAPRQATAPVVESRRNEASRNIGAPRFDRNVNGRYEGQAVPRHEAAPRVYSPQVYSPRVYAPRVYSPRVYSPRVYGLRVYAPRYYGYRPYVFAPRTRLSFGIFLGYPVPYG